MSNDKFIEQISTAVKFIQIYCDDKHKNEVKNAKELSLIYKNENLHTSIKYNLCKECEELVLYVYQRLQNCPHEEKPKCRKCPKTCYERDKYKQMRNIMVSSGTKLGLTKLAQKIGIKSKV
ncbi:nitrous oxide-stimulated promoter family protein [Campylobacter sp. RM12327]|uniref:nitrous oxide-stimulated promoter family protein n=1 Tax=Campylobacter sputorum TaxID=206 RepID=UPI000B77D24C|nr:MULTISPECIES: nitrous oxide-stimulated promoter family protein [Campylobacter]ASM40087.1 putative nitrous oxide-regulated protein [Campylobacter sputorum]MBE7358154.1 nitrous oxide-stimulated promoter family protein [Campylobacter sp. RM11302]MBF6669408.1 nitrous oxide-stimulated promoter family protein [Campylobacter sp. RM12327]MBF6674413.1 nitrous oxide-stimulated promoter family protein [Campylobacter sp. RM13538]MBF6676163.1 nitrous oxide-stimulated promoter family protein [Campylobact